jgi:hypothetical protein
MEPSKINSGVELPPLIEQSPLAGIPNIMPSGSEAIGQIPEMPKSTYEAMPSNISGPPIQAPAYTPPQLPPQSNDDGRSDATKASKTAGKKFFKDKELIDKEWVNKAKAIVAQTQDDPFKQSEQMSNLRAEYISREFNKTIKLSSY